MSFEKEEIFAGAAGTLGTAAGIGFATMGADAATLTAGLASAGALFGGGMATGIAVAAAAPIAAGAAAFGTASLVKSFIIDY